MTVWDFIGNTMSGLFDAMESLTLFYNISVWDIVLLFTVIGDIAVIISSIFGTGDEIE